MKQSAAGGFAMYFFEPSRLQKLIWWDEAFICQAAGEGEKAVEAANERFANKIGDSAGRNTEVRDQKFPSHPEGFGDHLGEMRELRFGKAVEEKVGDDDIEGAGCGCESENVCLEEIDLGVTRDALARAVEHFSR
jgi:hypothetical protein